MDDLEREARFEMLIANFQDGFKIQAYDTDLSIQGVDVEIMISKADSGPGLSSKSLAGPFLSAQ